MPRVLMLNYEFPPLGAGAANAAYYILKEFSRYPGRISVDLIASSACGPDIQIFSPNVKIHFLDVAKHGKNLHYQSYSNILIYALKSYLYAKKLIKKNNFDLCHAFFTVPCGYTAMKLNIPYIVSLRGSDVPFYNTRFYYLDMFCLRHLARKVWDKSRAVVSNSEGLKRLALSTKPDHRILTIHNGVDTEEFVPSSGKRTGRRLRLISVGRLIERKRYDVLIKAISGIRDIELLLIGEGALEKKLKNQAMFLKANVRFLGKKTHSQIKRFLQHSDVFVMPSVNEGMSNAVLEAMACGLPVIMSYTGGAEELVKGNGFIVKKSSPMHLREAIELYRVNRELISTHGIISRKLAVGMSWEYAALEYMKIYEKI